MVSVSEFMARFEALPGWVQSGFKAALVVLIGWLILKVLDRYLDTVLARTGRDDRTLDGFITRVVEIVGWVIIGVTVLATVGVDPAGLLGGLAIGGFVIGFALKDSLGNLAAGVMLLVYRPFNVGDTVTIDGQSGEVTRLGMALTTIKAADGRIITVPNGGTLGSTIINHTREPIRRADVLVGIGYDDDIGTAVDAILGAVKQDPRVLAEPEPGVRITELGNSSVGLQVRPWVRTDDYWQAQADLHGTIKKALEEAGCSIPYPQQDVHLIEAS